jgi:hypothetical protein
VLIFVCASDSPRVGLRVLRMMVHDASLVHDTSLVHDAPSARASSHMLCRVLEVPLIGYMGPKIRHAEVYPDFTRDYFRLMADLVVLGAMSGRLAVVPPVDCDSEWIARNPATASGVDQGPWRWDWHCSLQRAPHTPQQLPCCCFWHRFCVRHRHCAQPSPRQNGCMTSARA